MPRALGAQCPLKDGNLPQFSPSALLPLPPWPLQCVCCDPSQNKVLGNNLPPPFPWPHSPLTFNPCQLHFCLCHFSGTAPQGDPPTFPHRASQHPRPSHWRPHYIYPFGNPSFQSCSSLSAYSLSTPAHRSLQWLRINICSINKKWRRVREWKIKFSFWGKCGGQGVRSTFAPH